MNDTAKLAKIKLQLNISSADMDAKLNDYLDSAKQEILSWMYINYPEVPEDVIDVPAKYEITQIQAVVAGFGLEGGENEISHNENGISRTFKYSNMVDFVRAHVFHIV